LISSNCSKLASLQGKLASFFFSPFLLAELKGPGGKGRRSGQCLPVTWLSPVLSSAAKATGNTRWIHLVLENELGVEWLFS